MISGILAAVVIFFLFYERLSFVLLLLLCVTTGVFLVVIGRHSHTHFYTIDVIAQMSNLNRWNAVLKFWVILALMVICIASRNPLIGIFITVIMLLITVFVGKIKVQDYVHLIALPLSFLLLGGIALVIEITDAHQGVLSIQIFGMWFSVTADSQLRATLVIARAIGAVSCLYALSLTTTMSEIIGVLKRARCPDVVVELMYLIYRYIFVLLNMYNTMNDASKSRLGHINYKTSVRTTANIYYNLLARSYRQSNVNFDAMESRCYETGIQFFESKKIVNPIQIIQVAVLLTLCLGMTLWLF